MCKNLNITQSTKQIKELPKFERHWEIYEQMMEIGKAINAQLSKGSNTQIN